VGGEGGGGGAAAVDMAGAGAGAVWPAGNDWPVWHGLSLVHFSSHLRHFLRCIWEELGEISVTNLHGIKAKGEP